MAGKPASRQRKWQLKQREAGLCALCPQAVEKWGLCSFHVEQAIKRRQKGVSRPYLPKWVWFAVDWSMGHKKIASMMGVTEATVRYHWKKVTRDGI
jgi:hypothetical protein